MKSSQYFDKFCRKGRTAFFNGGFKVKFKDNVKEWEKLCRFLTKMQKEGQASSRNPKISFARGENKIVLILKKRGTGKYKARIIFPDKNVRTFISA